jgi:deoxyxylulose-5-phosphate synthase
VPAAIRYPNSGENERVKAVFYPDGPACTIGVRTSFCAGDGNPDAVVVCHGRMVQEALAAADSLAGAGIRLGIILCEYLKPYDRLAQEVAACLPDRVPVLFAEEEIKAGGFGMMLAEALRHTPAYIAAGSRAWDILAVEDSFVFQEKPEPIRHTAGVDSPAIADRVRRLLTQRGD